MKIKYFLVLLFLGFCVDFVGALFKIQHWAGADLLLISGMALKALGVVGLLLKLLTHPKLREFLNW
ncbi:GldL-related protein [Hymenobacter canadensis]|uniref:Gliding motility protein GldL-like N-terminal domain-containing protein n=1 Tax=Hymenobacter canadensis TaxID=2999067 RepID=A0ABY7LSG7_9BACT|nr:hypothetical protein [Hymenobacter canadensis]WBA43355.1 hypothetical protein O3303_07250 [Hymenobacter canadensis]